MQHSYSKPTFKREGTGGHKGPSFHDMLASRLSGKYSLGGSKSQTTLPPLTKDQYQRSPVGHGKGYSPSHRRHGKKLLPRLARLGGGAVGNSSPARDTSWGSPAAEWFLGAKKQPAPTLLVPSQGILEASTDAASPPPPSLDTQGVAAGFYGRPESMGSDFQRR